MYAVPAPSEKTPTVLVVGATGETGRQVVKKLILKGASMSFVSTYHFSLLVAMM